MKIDCFMNYHALNREVLEDKVVVVFDVLRATSTMITALANGASRIIAVDTMEAAQEAKARFPEALLCGEREGVIIPGFDLGNSPGEFTIQVVGGKTLITSTTNGTPAICAAQGAQEIWLGAILNARAVAMKAFDQAKDLALVCAGTNNQASVDDLLGAGSVVYHICQDGQECRLNDSARLAQIVYEKYRDNLCEGLLASNHGQKLHSMGHSLDILHCAREGWEIIPILKNGCFSLEDER
ncbi:MAG: 2-phosphosulfolactate phosphatase [Clostridiales bacterium]|nr:2-phosphosulfolactate phosphatase [Clostridiales bacterium]